jgi:biotin carboxyl carrier protein
MVTSYPLLYYLAPPNQIVGMPNYEITTNDRSYPVTEQDINALDLVSTGPNSYHLLKDGQSYHIEVLDLNPAAKTIVLRVNGRDQHMAISDETDLLVKELGFSTVEINLSKDVNAPMPGLVLDVLVAEGDTVEAGTPLIILEAMKMENVLKAEGDGLVTSIPVAKGDAVEKRQLLIEIE